jgi:hypothetical protein
VKTRYIVFATMMALFLTAPIASAKPAGLAQPAPAVNPEQDSHCENLTGSSYLRCVRVYYTAAAAPRPAGLAASAPAVNPEQGSHCENLSEPNYLRCVGVYHTAAAAPRPVGLAASAPAVETGIGWPICPSGTTYNPMTHSYPCLYEPGSAASAAAAKPAGLAQPAPAAP